MRKPPPEVFHMRNTTGLPLLFPALNPPKQNDQEECTLCRTWHSNLRHHLEHSHLQWYFNPFCVNWKQETKESRSASSIQHQRRISEAHHQKWGSLVLGALYFIAAQLEQTSLSDLFLYLSQRRLYPTLTLGRFTPEECRLLHYIESDLLTTTSGPVPVYKACCPQAIRACYIGELRWACFIFSTIRKKRNSESMYVQWIGTDCHCSPQGLLTIHWNSSILTCTLTCLCRICASFHSNSWRNEPQAVL